jgi:hypothetical protein
MKLAAIGGLRQSVPPGAQVIATANKIWLAQLKAALYQ